MLPDREYRLIVTNFYGMYRYDTEDVFRTIGRRYPTPHIEFVRKSIGFSNLTGEKLTEAQLMEAVRRASEHLQVGVRFFVGMPDHLRVAYRVYIEFCGTDRERAVLLRRMGECVDAGLAELNCEYAAKRSSGRLRSPVICALGNGALARYKEHYLQLGVRDAQFKVLCLRSDERDRQVLDMLRVAECDLGEDEKRGTGEGALMASELE